MKIFLISHSGVVLTAYMLIKAKNKETALSIFERDTHKSKDDIYDIEEIKLSENTSYVIDDGDY